MTNLFNYDLKNSFRFQALELLKTNVDNTGLYLIGEERNISFSTNLPASLFSLEAEDILKHYRSSSLSIELADLPLVSAQISTLKHELLKVCDCGAIQANQYQIPKDAEVALAVLKPPRLEDLDNLIRLFEPSYFIASGSILPISQITAVIADNFMLVLDNCAANFKAISEMQVALHNWKLPIELVFCDSQKNLLNESLGMLNLNICSSCHKSIAESHAKLYQPKQCLLSEVSLVELLPKRWESILASLGLDCLRIATKFQTLTEYQKLTILILNLLSLEISSFTILLYGFIERFPAKYRDYFMLLVQELAKSNLVVCSSFTKNKQSFKSDYLCISEDETKMELQQIDLDLERNLLKFIGAEKELIKFLSSSEQVRLQALDQNKLLKAFDSRQPDLYTSDFNLYQGLSFYTLFELSISEFYQYFLNFNFGAPFQLLIDFGLGKLNIFTKLKELSDGELIILHIVRQFLKDQKEITLPACLYNCSSEFVEKLAENLKTKGITVQCLDNSGRFAEL